MMLMNFCLLALLITVILLQKVPCLTSSSILKRIREPLQWNAPLRTFVENIIPLSAAVFLQLGSISFNGRYLIICMVFALVSLIYLLTTTFLIFRKIYKSSGSQLQEKSASEVYGTLYEGMDMQVESSKYYYFVVLMRGILLILLTVYVSSLPLLQIACLILFNVVFVYYLVKGARFEKSIQDKINKAKEVLILIIEICILCLFFKFKVKVYYQVLGWIIFGAVCLIILMDAGYLISLQVLGIPKLWAKVKALPQTLSKCCKKKPKKVNRKRKMKVRNPRPKPTTDDSTVISLKQ